MRSKVTTTLLIVLIVFFAVMPFLLISTQQAEAFAFTDVPHILMQVGKFAWERAKSIHDFVAKQGGAVAYRNVVNTYMARIARESAQWAATGFKGSKPMFLEKPDKFLDQLKDDAAGEFIDQLAQGSFIDQSLCEPIDPTIKLRIMLSLKKPEIGKIPEKRLCSLSTIRKRVEEARKKKLFEFGVDVREGRTYNFKTRLKSIISADKMMTTYARTRALYWESVLQWRQAKLEEEIAKLKKLLEAPTGMGSTMLPPDEGPTFEELLKAQKDLEKLEKEYKQRKEAIEDIKNFNLAKECIGKKEELFCANDACRFFCPKVEEEGHYRYANEQECKNMFKQCYDSAKASSIFTNRLGDWETAQKEMIAEMKEMIKEGRYQDIGTKGTVAAIDTISKSFSPSGTDVGALFTLLGRKEDKAEKAKEQGKFTQELTGMWKNVESPVSGEVKTPASVGKRRVEETVKNPVSQGAFEYTGSLIADTLNLVATTYLNYLIKQLFESPGGLNPKLNPEGVSIGEGVTSSYKPLFAGISTVKLLRGGQTKLLEEHYAACPTQDLKFALPTNCVADDGLVQAARNKLTIKEAMAQDLLHPGWIVGGKPEELKELRNPQTSEVYTLENIKKLRKARVLPLGLEIAAHLITKGEVKRGGVTDYNVTLKEVVDGFSQKGSPFYRLVDPNWVIKSFPFNCALRGYSAVPMAGSNRRQETCLDWQDCIAENEKGDCLAYGYCLAEKNEWRLGGDACDAQYASCATFQRESDNQQFSYLVNTLDTGNCGPENVGCQWYCRDWNENLGENGAWACSSPGKSYLGICELGEECSQGSDSYQPEIGKCRCSNERGECLVSSGADSCFIGPVLKDENVIFLNRAVEKCDSRYQGCSEFIRIKPGLNTNLLANGDFSYFEGRANTEEDGSWQEDGFPGWEKTNDSIELYALDQEEPALKIVIPSGVSNQGVRSYKIEINPEPWERYLILTGSRYIPSTHSDGSDNDLDGEWSISINTYIGSSGPGEDFEKLEGKGESWDNDTEKDEWQKVWQSIKLEPNVSGIVVSVIGEEGETWIKQLQVIETSEPVLNSEDLPEYQEYGKSNLVYYKEAPDYYHCYDSDESNDNVECINFLEKCNKENVGCELYTPALGGPEIPGIVNYSNYCPSTCQGYNIFRQQATNFDLPEDGLAFIPKTAKICPASEVGCEEFTNLDTEKKEYYSYIRQCIKTDKNDVPVIGDDGNPADADDVCAYYYTWVGTEEAGYQLQKYFLKKGPDNNPAQIITNQDDWPKYWGECEEEDDILINPHCKQFYTSDGNISYRIWENTITCSPDCHPYRKTIPALAQGGRTLFMAIPSQGIPCSPSNVGCREYKGPTANNLRQIFFDTFEEQAQVDLWGEIQSEESVNRDGHSIKAEGSSAERPVEGEVENNGLYSVSLWVKGSGDYSVYFTDGTSNLPSSPQSISVISSEWQELKFDPIYFSREAGENEKLVITGPSLFYVDNVTLTKVQDSLFLVKDSWYTPPECSPDMIGCSLYKDSLGLNHYLHSFASLCPEEEVGCEALIKTQNSTFPFEKEFNKENDNDYPDKEDNVTIAADEIVYRLLKKEYKCPSDQKACQRLGKPELSPDGEIYSYKDIYLISNPNYYSWRPILCHQEDQGCEKFRVLGGYGPEYFKDPEGKVCEYRAVTQEGGGGWYKVGTNEPCCYDENDLPYYKEPGIYGIYTSNNPLYKGYAGLCPVGQSGCTEFLDPLGETVWFEDFEDDRDGNGLADGWSITCGGDHDCSNCSDNIDNVVPSGNRIMETADSIHGAKHQKLEISNSEQCRSCIGGTCSGVSDVIFYKHYNPDQINIVPGQHYIFSAYGKTTDSTNGWKLLVRADYDISQDECNRLKEKDKRWNYSSDGGFCYYTVESSNMTEKGWHQNSVRFSIPEKYYNNLKFLRFHLRGPKALGATIEYDYLSLKTYKPYYYIDNDKLDRTSCGEEVVGLKDGCVLFFNPNKRDENGELIYKYNSIQTYEKSFLQPIPDTSVSPVIDCSSSDSCDANEIFKVERDRVCAQWLTCISSHSEWSSAIGGYINICDAYGRCDKLAGSGASATCAHFIDPPDIYKKQGEIVPLSKEAYQNRDISWTGVDYDGYTLYNVYPVELLKSVSRKGKWVLGYQAPDGTSYGINSTEENEGLYIEKTCRLFPEADSPFKNSVKEYYPKVNLCLPNGGGDSTNDLFPQCQCAYTKAEYSGQTLYFNYGNKPWEGVERKREGPQECVPSPSNPGCLALTKETNYLGQRGYCLEKDTSKPSEIDACLTWYPGTVSGDPDINNQFEEAGYVAKNKIWYCVKEQQEGDTFYYDVQASDIGNPDKEQLCQGGGKKCDDRNGWCVIVEHMINTKPRSKPEQFEVSKKGGSRSITFDYMGPEFYFNQIKEIKIKVVSRDDSYDWEGDVCKGYDKDDNWKWEHGYHEFSIKPPAWKSESYFNGHGGIESFSVDFDNKGRLAKISINGAKDKDRDSGTFWVDWVRIYLKSGCREVIKIANENDNNLTKAYTNRVNKFKNYYGDNIKVVNPAGETITINYDNKCSPWGAISSWDESRYIAAHDDEQAKCEDKNNLIYAGSIYEDAKEKVKDKLFAKTYEYKEFNESNLSYEEKPDENWDITNSLPSDHYPPQVASVKCDDSGCSIPKGGIGKMTINGKDNEGIYGKQVVGVSLKFYAWADKNHMPIREVQVDWDDGNISGNSNMMAKNHKPMCCESAENCENLKGVANTDRMHDIGIYGDITESELEDDTCKGDKCFNFGNIPAACVSTVSGRKGDAYFLFSHTYRCEQGGAGWERYGCSNACCFKPKVYVKDNWDWCNGGEYVGEGGKCLEEAGRGHGGTEFSKIIRVEP